MSKAAAHPAKPPRRITHVGTPIYATAEQKQAALESPEFQEFLRAVAQMALNRTRRIMAAEAALRETQAG